MNDLAPLIFWPLAIGISWAVGAHFGTPYGWATLGAIVLGLLITLVNSLGMK